MSVINNTTYAVVLFLNLDCMKVNKKFLVERSESLRIEIDDPFMNKIMKIICLVIQA